MFATLKAVINNLNETKYIANRDEIEFKELEEVDANNKLVISNDKIIRELNNLQIDARHNNLKLFVTNFFKARLKQFFIYTTPALMIASNIFLALAGKDTKTESLDAYKLKETIMSDEGAITIESDDTYYEVLVDREYVNSSDHNINSAHDDLDVWIFGQNESICADFSIDSSGKLSVAQANMDVYVDITDYDMSDATELTEKQERLIKEALTSISESSYLNSEEQQRVKELIEDESVDFLAIYKDYEYLGELDVETNKSGFGRGVWFLVSILYIAVLLWIRKETGPFTSHELFNEDGVLRESRTDDDLGIIYLAMKYKEIFKKAEEDRVKRIKKLGYSNCNAFSFDKTLTNYEKKIN